MVLDGNKASIRTSAAKVERDFKRAVELFQMAADQQGDTGAVVSSACNIIMSEFESNTCAELEIFIR